MEGRMYESQQQHLLDLQDSSGFGSDPKSWLSGAGDDLSRTLSSLSAAAATASATGSVDPVLFNDLVEMVPLVQSLIDRKSNSSFTRRGSMIYTKTPSREALYKKAAGKSATLPTKKPRDQGDRNAANSQDVEDLAALSSRMLLAEKDREELMTLRDQVEDLKRQISEKDELLDSAELLKNDLASIQTKYEELKSEAAEKDSLIKSSQLQLSDAKVKLADKQAAVEKLQWEAMTSNKKVERLQEDLDKVQGEISSFMLLIEGLTRNDSAISAGDYDDIIYPIDQNHEIDLEMDMQELEATREAYITAVAAAKELQNEESISAAARARFHLRSLVLQQS